MEPKTEEAWAEKYDDETLERAYAVSFSVAQDPVHMMDVEWHKRLAANRARILAEMLRRGLVT